jgi:hypothetical protein
MFADCPETVDTPPENQCRIKAVVSLDQISTADKRKLYKVREVWSVDKREPTKGKP